VGVFRQDYGYCNSCYMTAGEVIPAATGQSWEAYVTDSLIRPLGMNNTYALSAGMEKRPNAAAPYTTNYTGTLKRVPYDQWDNLAPAASIVSNVADLAKWLRFQLDSGKFQGNQVVPWPALQKTRDVNTMIGSRKSSVFPMHFRGYGLGVISVDYNGRQVYSHTGGAAGMLSGVCFVPEEKLGIAILSTNDNQNFFEALRYQVLDAYLGVTYVNRSQQQLQGFNQAMKKQLQEIGEWQARTGKSKPALPLAAYAGEYQHPLYGKLGIAVAGNQLKLKFYSHADLSATMEYMDNNEWLLQYDNIEYGIFSTKFTTAKGKVSSVLIKANEFVEIDPYTFIKK
jgi:CubicO group peptidase (beta-lactamase class C family)